MTGEFLFDCPELEDLIEVCGLDYQERYRERYQIMTGEKVSHSDAIELIKRQMRGEL